MFIFSGLPCFSLATRGGIWYNDNRCKIPKKSLAVLRRKGNHMNSNDFEIQNGVLTKYRGKGGNVTIPDGVTSIGKGAFCWCESLTSVIIPDGVTSIEDIAFEGCKSLTSVTIPDGVTSIGNYAFRWCESLTSVNIPEGVTSIEDSAFEDCKSLTSVTIHDGVTSIGNYAFGWCESLVSVNIPNSVTSIGDRAFCYCKSLTSVNIPDGVKTISLLFGEEFPVGLIPQISSWYPRMTDGALKQYVLNKKTWNMLDSDTQEEIWSAKYSKALMKFFLPLMTERIAECLATQYLANTASKISVAECNKISNFMITYQTRVSDTTLQSLYEALRAQKNSKKALEAIGKDLTLSAKLSEAGNKPKKLTEMEKKLFAFVETHKLSVAELTQKLKDYYSLTAADIPPVQDIAGNPVEKFAMLYLLTAHETYDSYGDVIAQYKKPGVSPEAAEIVSLLDQASLQNALRELANRNLGMTGHSKKMYLAYPICRYADETLMDELTKQAPKWRSSVSGNEAPPLRTFRDACVYSETRAALLFAEKYKDLDEFASVRGTTADLLRDRVLSDIGLAPDGTKTYALGNQTVKAVLQSDLGFIIQLENGKTAKSLPKKGADPAAYETSNADFTAMKKNAKKIVKSRNAVLFEEFLSGKSRPADEWKAAYTENPLLRTVASLLVWAQNKKTFILTANGAVTSDGQPCEIGDTQISLAHPMEMDGDDLRAWQKYFVSNGLKQPFEQIWEPVVDPNTVTKDRYKGCMIPYYRFTGKQKHGISVWDEDFHNEIDISFTDLDAYVEQIDWRRHEIDPNDRFEVTSVSFETYTRMTNHIIAYLDRVTVYGRIANDDISVEIMLPSFTLAQITEFIRIATENNAVNVTALLLNYKNVTYPDFDPFDEFSLDLLD